MKINGITKTGESCGAKREADIGRLLFLDMARAVMLVFVILEHTEAAFLSSFVDNFMLPVFWFASGYTFRGAVNFRRKAANILVPYGVMTVICILFTVFYLGRAFEWVDIWGAAYGRFVFYATPPGSGNEILMPVCNSVLWFLPSFFVSWCFFILLTRLDRPVARMAGVVACVGLTWCATFLPVLLPWSIDTAPAFGAVMYAGYLVARHSFFRSKRQCLLLFLSGAILYVVLNYITGGTNISIRNFGRSVWLWYPAAVVGAVSFTSLCRLFDGTLFCRLVAWFNKGALFIFGLQLVFITLAADSYEGCIDSWKIRVTVVLIFCFFGGKIIDLLYSGAVRLFRTAVL